MANRKLGRLLNVTLLATVIALVAPRAANAANRCVDNTDGGCVAAGSFAVCPTNYCSIGAAITDSSGGDTITVAAGTYNEQNLFLTSAKSPLTLRGAQAGVPACGRVASETIISNTVGPLLDLGDSHDTVVDGFTFTGVTGGGLGGSSVIQSSVGPNNRDQLLNNRVNGFTGTGVFLNRAGADMTVDNNELDGSSQTGNADVFHLDTKDFAGFHFTNNCVQNGRATCFFVDGNRTVHPGAPGTRAPLFDSNLIRNCNTGTNLGSRSFTGGTISNNVFSNNRFDGLQGGIQSTGITHNEFLGNGRNGLTLTSFGNTTDSTRGAQFDTITENGFCGNGFGTFCSTSGASCTNDSQCPTGQTCVVLTTSSGIFFSASQFAGTISTNIANHNNISGNNAGATYTGGETVDATLNWWGCPTGPNTPGCDTAGPSATLLTTPFLTSPATGAASCGAPCDPGDPCVNQPPPCGPLGTNCFCFEPVAVSGPPGNGSCVNDFACDEPCTTDVDCTDPARPVCYQTGCPNQSNMCPLPICGPSQCTPTTTTTSTTSTTESTTTTTTETTTTTTETTTTTTETTTTTTTTTTETTTTTTETTTTTTTTETTTTTTETTTTTSTTATTTSTTSSTTTTSTTSTTTTTRPTTTTTSTTTTTNKKKTTTTTTTPTSTTTTTRPVTGYMTGGGNEPTTTGQTVTFNGGTQQGATQGLLLHCNAASQPNNLQVNWANNSFHLQQLVSATCSNDGLSPQPPPAGFDVIQGSGTGRCNKLAATVTFKFADHGEPGTNDTVEIHITGGCTLDVSGNLKGGDIQAHNGQ